MASTIRASIIEGYKKVEYMLRWMREERRERGKAGGRLIADLGT
jgi:hypothetical protein